MDAMDSNLTTVVFLEHFIFKWDIVDVDLCFNSSFASSEFHMRDGSKWCLNLNICYAGKACNIDANIHPVQPIFGPVKVNFNLALQLLDETLWRIMNHVVHFQEGTMVGGCTFKMDLFTLQGMLNENTLTVVCQMIAVVPKEVIRYDTIFDLCTKDLSRDLITLLEDGSTANMELKLESGEIIPAHKEILSIWSEEFNNLINLDTKLLEIPNYTYDTVKSMLVFMYSGDINKLTCDNAPPPELYNCAVEYGVEGLSDILRPRELVYKTTPEFQTQDHEWNFPDFLTLSKHQKKIEEPPVKACFSEISEIKLILEFVEEDTVIFSIKITSKIPQKIIISIEICRNSVVISSKEETTQTNGGETSSFIHVVGASIFNDHMVLQDTLTVRCHVKVLRWKDIHHIVECASLPWNLDSDVYARNIFSQKMMNLYKFGLHTDTKIHTDNIEVILNAHKSVLSARSPLLQAFLHRGVKSSGKRHLILHYSPRSANELLAYLYTGTLDNTYSIRSLIDLHDMGVKFYIPHLRDNCLSILYQRMTRFNACRICSFADYHVNEHLKNVCFECIYQNRHEILNSVKWKYWIEKNKTLKTEIDKYISNKLNTVF